jgi:hypothetical protein
LLDQTGCASIVHLAEDFIRHAWRRNLGGKMDYRIAVFQRWAPVSVSAYVAKRERSTVVTSDRCCSPASKSEGKSCVSQPLNKKAAHETASACHKNSFHKNIPLELT